MDVTPPPHQQITLRYFKASDLQQQSEGRQVGSYAPGVVSRVSKIEGRQGMPTVK